jgi:hypothetical protein
MSLHLATFLRQRFRGHLHANAFKGLELRAEWLSV